MPEFKAFPKIPRLYRDVVITEKIDGTNACVVVTETPGAAPGTQVLNDGVEVNLVRHGHGSVTVQAQSRKRFITPESDNYGFAAWVWSNAEELAGLGPGHHYGEWYGQGIQRGYGMTERRFALFNVKRWSDADERPECCDVVPVLAEMPFNEQTVHTCLYRLAVGGSQVHGGLGFNPEGIVVYHTAGNHLYKVLLENDELPKSAAA